MLGQVCRVHHAWVVGHHQARRANLHRHRGLQPGHGFSPVRHHRRELLMLHRGVPVGRTLQKMGAGPLKVRRAHEKLRRTPDLYGHVPVQHPRDGPECRRISVRRQAQGFVPRFRKPRSVHPRPDARVQTPPSGSDGVPPASSAATLTLSHWPRPQITVYTRVRRGDHRPLHPSNRRGCDKYIKLLETNFFEIDSWRRC